MVVETLMLKPERHSQSSIRGALRRRLADCATHNRRDYQDHLWSLAF